jgi:hypothetical protein
VFFTSSGFPAVAINLIRISQHVVNKVVERLIELFHFLGIDRAKRARILQ